MYKDNNIRIDATGSDWLNLGFRDLFAGLTNISLVHHLASQDLKLRYRRTVLGPIWTVINAIVFVGCLGLVYSFLFKMDLKTYLPFFGVGYFVWMTIMAMCMESSACFVQAELIIKSIRVPYTSHVLRCVLRNIYTFFHMLPVALALSIIFGISFTIESVIQCIIGLILLAVNGTWVSILFAIISTRFRDFQQIISTVLQILFFTTPIFWDPKTLDGHALAAFVLRDYNPVFQQIQVIRAPLIGEAISWGVYGALTLTAVIGCMFAAMILGWSIRKISIWL